MTRGVAYAILMTPIKERDRMANKKTYIVRVSAPGRIMGMHQDYMVFAENEREAYRRANRIAARTHGKIISLKKKGE